MTDPTDATDPPDHRGRTGSAGSVSSAGPSPAALSARSGRVRAARRLLRRSARAEHGLFLAEGPQAVREALAVPGCVREVLALDGAHLDLQATAVGIAWLIVDDAALSSLTETVHPQGVVAVCRSLHVALDDFAAQLAADRAGALAGPSSGHFTGPPPGDLTVGRAARALVAVCAEVRDPGNAGTVVRCADAAGASGVILAGQSVDLYNGKTVRASAGSIFHLPVVVEASVPRAVEALRGQGLTVLAADAGGEIDLDAAAEDGLLGGPTAWLFGNEAWGLTEETAALGDHRVRIPIHGRAESLNLATAAALCLYASAREQRRRH